MVNPNQSLVLYLIGQTEDCPSSCRQHVRRRHAFSKDGCRDARQWLEVLRTGPSMADWDLGLMNWVMAPIPLTADRMGNGRRLRHDREDARWSADPAPASWKYFRISVFMEV